MVQVQLIRPQVAGLYGNEEEEKVIEKGLERTNSWRPNGGGWNRVGQKKLKIDR